MNGGGSPGAALSSKITFDSDLTVPAAYKIKVDHIAETTASHGVVCDSNAKNFGGMIGAALGGW